MDNDIVFPDIYEISPRHIKIGYSNQGYFIKDIAANLN